MFWIGFAVAVLVVGLLFVFVVHPLIERWLG